MTIYILLFRQHSAVTATGIYHTPWSEAHQPLLFPYITMLVPVIFACHCPVRHDKRRCICRTGTFPYLYYIIIQRSHRHIMFNGRMPVYDHAQVMEEERTTLRHYL